MKIKRDRKKLPKWVQQEFNVLEFRLAELNGRLKQTEAAHSLLTNPALEWFTIGVHTPEKRKLYFLDKDHANHGATVGAGSFIMVAHPKQP